MSHLDSIPYDYLRKNAFNMRWAEVPSDVIPLTAADTDMPIAKEITDAIVAACSPGLFPYGPSQGLVGFRTAITHHYNTRKECQISSSQVLATNSAATALQDWCNHFLVFGDEVLIPDPVDFLLGYCAEKAGATIKRVPAQKQWNEDLWQREINEKTKALFICHPHNPLGFHYDKTTLVSIAQFAKKNNLLLLSDEVWSDVILQDQYTSMMAVSEDCWVVYGLSKGYGLAGLRIGALIGPNEKSILELMDTQGYLRTTQGVSTLSQIAAEAAMRSPNAAQDFATLMKANIERAHHRLTSEQSFFKSECPSSTFVMWLQHPENWDTLSLTQQMEREAKVKLVPGLAQWFGPGAKGHIRMSCATAPEVLEEALSRIIQWANAHATPANV